MRRLRNVAIVILALAAVAQAPAPHPAPGWLGLGYTYNQSKDGAGWLHILYVLDGGPALTAGMQVGDVVTDMDGKPLRFKTAFDLMKAMADLKPGQKVTLTVIRAQKSQKITVVAVEMPPEQAARWQRNWAAAAREKH